MCLAAIPNVMYKVTNAHVVRKLVIFELALKRAGDIKLGLFPVPCWADTSANGRKSRDMTALLLRMWTTKQAFDGSSLPVSLGVLEVT